MNSDIDMNQIQKKSFYSTIVDGLDEIFIGLMLLLGSIIFINIFTEFLVAIIIVLFRIKWSSISNKLKEKYIFPRIGFVELRTDHKKRIKRYHQCFTFLIGISIIIFFILVFLNGLSIDSAFKYIPIIVGSSILGRTFYYFLFSGKLRFLWIGILSLILAFIFIFLPFSAGKIHVIIYMIIEALIIFTLGLVKLKIFLRENEIIEEM